MRKWEEGLHLDRKMIDNNARTMASMKSYCRDSTADGVTVALIAHLWYASRGCLLNEVSYRLRGHVKFFCHLARMLDVLLDIVTELRRAGKSCEVQVLVDQCPACHTSQACLDSFRKRKPVHTHLSRQSINKQETSS